MLSERCLHGSVKGWAYHTPDDGFEWSHGHPVVTGECLDATKIARVTLAEFRRAEEYGYWDSGAPI